MKKQTDFRKQYHRGRKLALGIALAFLPGLGSIVEAQQCTNMNNGPGALFNPVTARCMPKPPEPVGSGACNCVVSVFTSRRTVRAGALFQECRNHYGDGNCRQLAGGSGTAECDGNHSAPFGNWGVRLRGAAVTNNTLSDPQVTEMSEVRDCDQWPGTQPAKCGIPLATRDCRQWFSCSCDDKKGTAGHFGSSVPAFDPMRDTVSESRVISAGKTTDHLAGFFKIKSTTDTCRLSLQGKEVAFRFNLEVLELDLDKSDRVATFPVEERVPMNCFGGRCEGSKPLSLNADPLSATGFVQVVCSGLVRPGPPPGDGGGGSSGCTPGNRCQSCCRGLCGQGLLCLADNQCHGTVQSEGGLMIETCSSAN